MDKHLSVWQHVKEMTRTHDRFVRNFKKLTDHKAVLDQDLKSMMDKHVKIKKELVDRIVPVMGVVSVYANDTGNSVLKKRFSAKAKKVQEMKDKQLLELSEAFNSFDNKEQKGKSKSLSLIDYGLTREMAEEIKTKSVELKKSIASIEEAWKERNKSTQAVKRLINRNDKILNSRTDKFVRLFRKSNPDFYHDYRQARKSRTEKTVGSPLKAKAETKPVV
jgi:hypothetical protein